ncbi:sensor histidine kinase [Candidatus Hydrogenedentota bacterium]
MEFERLNVAVESTREYHVTTDAKGRVRGESKLSFLSDLLGFRIEDCEGDECPLIYDYLENYDAISPGLGEQLSQYFRELLENGNEFEAHGDFLVGKEELHLHFTGRLINNLDGTLGATFVVLDDTPLTETKRFYEYLFRLANHELRNPLSSILVAVDLIRSAAHEKGLSNLFHLAEVTERNTHAAISMIDRYLNLSRIESGELHIRPRTIDFGQEVFREVRRAVSVLAHANDVHVVFKSSGETGIVADPEALYIILTNLVSNGIKYGRKGSDVLVRLETGPESHSISVENEGDGGIPPDKAETVFEKFRRLDNPVTDRERGSGLGLYNTKELVKLCGGRIEVESEIGGVTVFKVTLPAKT